MKTIHLSVSLLMACSAFAGTEHRISKEEYVDQWSPVAVEQMLQHGIPASITLAQGILESANGNSELALKGNNHFGIKCHGWDGKKMYIDDDAKNECFRVYKSADESYRDHSEFLKGYNRYAFLFEYSADDYVSWAKGLKKAGYATNPKYPDLLIGIIEDLNLNRFDEMASPELAAPMIATSSSMKANSHQVQIHERGVRYVVAKKGDTFYKIAQECGLTLSQLYRFNDFGGQKDFLEPGDVVYIQAKKRGKLFGKEDVVVQKEMTLDELSQVYAVNKQTIIRLNGYTENIEVIAKGEKVTLR